MTHRSFSCLLTRLAERLRVFPFPVVRVNSTGVATITIMFTQFDGTPEVLKTFYVCFLPDGASEAEKLQFDPILESRIENGVASFSFNATENGTITAEAEFTVGLDPGNHRVTSDPVRLICKWGTWHLLACYLIAN